MSDKHRSQLGRLRKVEGQVRGVQRMIEDDRYCMDILTQMRAIHRALEKVEEQVLAEHVQSCVTDAIRSGDEREREEKLQELMDVFASVR
ncbi:MAG: transcriptional regulator [Dehalococcoidia bacterium]|nr:transcriptional regulator [Dehalococcoidia bacterium]